MKTSTAKREPAPETQLRSELQRHRQFTELLCMQLHRELDEIKRSTGSRQRALCSRAQASLGTIAEGQRLAQGGELARESFDLHAVARAAVASHAFVANEHSVRLRCYVHREAPRQVVGDKRRLARLIGDLVASMIAASEGENVSVFVASAESQDGVPAARFTICDGGADLDSHAARRGEHSSSYWTPWYASVRDLVQRMGGDIRCYTSAEEGTVVTFRLAFDAKLPRRTRTELATQAPVLLVCRNRSRISAVSTLLHQQGHVVITEADPRRVPQLLQQGSYGMVLMDPDEGVGNTTFAARTPGKRGVQEVPVLSVPVFDDTREVDGTALLVALQQRLRGNRA